MDFHLLLVMINRNAYWLDKNLLNQISRFWRFEYEWYEDDDPRLGSIEQVVKAFLQWEELTMVEWKRSLSLVLAVVVARNDC